MKKNPFPQFQGQTLSKDRRPTLVLTLKDKGRRQQQLPNTRLATKPTTKKA